MKTGAVVKRILHHFLFSFLFAAIVDRRRGGAGPGGAPAAAQRRGRPTWTRDEPAAGWLGRRGGPTEGTGGYSPRKRRGWGALGAAGSRAHLSIASSVGGPGRMGGASLR